MSEYQYYEFQAIDRPLDRAAQEALRSISSRARISATSFTNHYEWGDLKGDPCKLMEQWFDLHLYLTNRSEEHTSELQSLMRISYAVFCLKKKIKTKTSCT